MNIPQLFGLQKTSLVDYPGKVASVLFFPGCNLRCPYCHNPDLVYGSTEGLIPRDEILDFLKFRAPLLGGVVLSGGEPLLYPGISSFIRLIKEKTGLNVKVDTNGLNPDTLTDLGADYIAMDLKAPPDLYYRLGGDQNAPANVRRSLEILKNSDIPYEIRTTVVPSIFSLEEAVEMASCLQDGVNHIITGFRPGTCLDPAYNSFPALSAEELEEYLQVFLSAGCSTKSRTL